MTEFKTIRLLGGSHNARRSYSHTDHRFEWRLAVEVEDPTALDWEDVPQGSGRATIEGEPLTIAVKVDHGRRIAFTWTELREIGAELKWARTNPNGARLREIQKLLGYYRKVYAEAQAPDALVLTLRYDSKHGSWQAGVEQDRYRIVYTYRAGRFGDSWLPKGRPRVYRAERTLVDHPPTADRKGFKLVAVSDHGEYLDPDAEIARLEAAIAAGNP